MVISADVRLTVLELMRMCDTTGFGLAGLCPPSLLLSSSSTCNGLAFSFSVPSLLKVFVEYFKQLEEESIKDNFVIIYELLDELMDFGYPQTTETRILQEYVINSFVTLFFKDYLAKSGANNTLKRPNGSLWALISIGWLVCSSFAPAA